MASTKATYTVDPIFKSTTTVDLRNYLGYSRSTHVGVIYALKNHRTDLDYFNTLAYWFYNYSFSGTWPNVTLTLDGQLTTYFGETPLNPTTRICVASIGVFEEGQNKDIGKMTNWTTEKDALFITSAYSTTTGDDSFGYWWILTPFQGEVTNTFAIDTSNTSKKKPEITVKLITALQSTPHLTAQLSGSLTNYKEEETVLTFSYPEPTMTLSLRSVSNQLAAIDITDHTNPLSYWRYKVQWKLSTASSWSTINDDATIAEPTDVKLLNTTSLTPGATYDYRIVYIDRNDNVVGNSNSISFTIPDEQVTVYVNSGGTVKKAKVWYNNGGTIKKVKNIYYNSSGTIKKVKK